jgi:hypothetical protein
MCRVFMGRCYIWELLIGLCAKGPEPGPKRDLTDDTDFSPFVFNPFFKKT